MKLDQFTDKQPNPRYCWDTIVLPVNFERYDRLTSYQLESESLFQDGHMLSCRAPISLVTQNSMYFPG